MTPSDQNNSEHSPDNRYYTDPDFIEHPTYIRLNGSRYYLINGTEIDVPPTIVQKTNKYGHNLFAIIAYDNDTGESRAAIGRNADEIKKQLKCSEQFCPRISLFYCKVLLCTDGKDDSPWGERISATHPDRHE